MASAASGSAQHGEMWEGGPGFWEGEGALHWEKTSGDKGHKAVGNQAAVLLVHME